MPVCLEQSLGAHRGSKQLLSRPGMETQQEKDAGTNDIFNTHFAVFKTISTVHNIKLFYIYFALNWST